MFAKFSRQIARIPLSLSGDIFIFHYLISRNFLTFSKIDERLAELTVKKCFELSSLLRYADKKKDRVCFSFVNKERLSNNKTCNYKPN